MYMCMCVMYYKYMVILQPCMDVTLDVQVVVRMNITGNISL